MSDEEYRDIDRRLQRLEEKLDVIMDATTRQAAICTSSRTKLDDMYKIVYGNGHEGLTTRLARIEATRHFWTSATTGVLGMLSGALLAVLAWLLDKKP